MTVTVCHITLVYTYVILYWYIHTLIYRKNSKVKLLSLHQKKCRDLKHYVYYQNIKHYQVFKTDLPGPILKSQVTWNCETFTHFPVMRPASRPNSLETTHIESEQEMQQNLQCLLTLTKIQGNIDLKK